MYYSYTYVALTPVLKLKYFSYNKIELGNKEIIFGIRGKKEGFIKYDFLYNADGPAFVVHQRVLDKLNELCTNDFQALPIIIKNCALASESFENKDFWLINILNIVDAIDQEKSGAYWRGDFLEFKKRMVKTASMAK